MSERYVLDTNILSAILKKERQTVQRYRAALSSNAELLICPVVYYELNRGLLHKDARKQLGFFHALADTMAWDDLRRADWEAASQLWSEYRQRGLTVSDADLLISVFAAQRDATIITDNVDHFQTLGVQVENWRR